MPEHPDHRSQLGPPPWSPQELAHALNGTLINTPDPTTKSLTGLAPLHATDPNAVAFARTPQSLAALKQGQLGLVLIPNDLSQTIIDSLNQRNISALSVPSPDHAINAALTAVHATTHHDHTPPGVHPSANIHEDATVHPTAHVGPGVTIGPSASIQAHAAIDANAYIGAHTTIGRHTYVGPTAKVLARCVIGDHCALHAGVVIGTDGFGYIPTPDGAGIQKVPHIGAVVVGDHVEIGANTCIDRGKLDNTTIGDGTKIDNLVQIGHNCTIGRAVIICGQAAIAGSCTIQDGAVIGGAAMLADNLTVGYGAKIGGGSGLMNSVPPGEKWFGVPAQQARDFFRALSVFRQLPTTAKAFKQRT